MPIKLDIPGRINILGNPGDANEGDFGVLSAAVEIRAHAVIQQAEEIVLEQTDPGYKPVLFNKKEFPLAYDGKYNLQKGAINRLLAFSPEFSAKIEKYGFHLQIHSDVPRQSGLGGSSLIVLLTLAGLRELYDLDRQKHNDYLLSELAQRVEAKELGIAAGYADRYVPLFGGLAYVDYRSKLKQTEIRGEPFATYERLDDLAPKLRFAAISTGIKHESGDVHGRLRPQYLAEYDNWSLNKGEMPPMVKFMSAAWECGWKGKIALLENDLAAVGQLMNKNHQLVNEMMEYCGFKDGAGWANNLFINSALENGALGAKLTGAGGGGSVFALVTDITETGIIKGWEELAAKNNLQDALIYRLEIAKKGLVIKK